MYTLLIQEKAYHRLKEEIMALAPGMKCLLMGAKGELSVDGRQIEPEEARPDLAWLSVEVFLTGRIEQFVRAVLTAGSVKWVQSFMAGLDLPFYREMLKQGIRVTRSNAQAVAIAEYVLANVLVLFQGVFERKRRQKDHRWQVTGFRELWRTKWLIVGFGNIGQEIAKRVKAFEGEVFGVRRSDEGHPLADRMIIPDRVHEYLPKSDVVVLACALNAETRGMADHSFFERMKQDAVFVNIARGKLVDQAAMIAALKRGRPAWAVLDVFDPEPLEADSPLWDMENVIISPHSSNAGNGTPYRGDRLFLENLKRFLGGQSLLFEAEAERL